MKNTMVATKIIILLILIFVGVVEGQIPPGSFKKLNGEIEPCLIDCRSIDLCVRGLLSCRATDGRQAHCRRCRCAHHYITYGQQGLEEVVCEDGRNGDSSPVPNQDVNQLKPFRRFDGQMESCMYDCRSRDFCTGRKKCATKDGRSAICIRCGCVEHYVAQGPNGPEQVPCAQDGGTSRSFGPFGPSNPFIRPVYPGNPSGLNYFPQYYYPPNSLPRNTFL